MDIKNKIINIFPDPKEHICRFNDGDCKCECYYQARTEMINKIPELINLIREDTIEKIRKFIVPINEDGSYQYDPQGNQLVEEIISTLSKGGEKE